jgi:hypothetical protein
MLPFIGARIAYGRAVRDAVEGLVAAYGERADEEAWRAARLAGLPPSEAAFCREVAERVSRRLGRPPHRVA